ncbi:hypothetical protein GLOTRDRAFT_132506 [Gloeophyllum trabeum ATCC 11539]|uniref:Uncharacterized protein n=1 Tax=Gloeophyllum trabeum (strain ATCC 11539 / FP-39264 / Madison 617) TaxID=670483 RepID=S7RIG7_GLOTA|nr:uncharacterized protein GLOTRDRAFT_132506 [Gloeophyllum trabeum ATCC 11539]EPQ52394.1 hypothetical protein GLOTRDRAFT_132506 [Gloeophyllum trabeum ATCC 11539]
MDNPLVQAAATTSHTETPHRNNVDDTVAPSEDNGRAPSPTTSMLLPASEDAAFADLQATPTPVRTHNPPTLLIAARRQAGPADTEDDDMPGLTTSEDEDDDEDIKAHPPAEHSRSAKAKGKQHARTPSTMPPPHPPQEFNGTPKPQNTSTSSAPGLPPCIPQGTPPNAEALALFNAYQQDLQAMEAYNVRQHSRPAASPLDAFTPPPPRKASRRYIAKPQPTLIVQPHNWNGRALAERGVEVVDRIRAATVKYSRAVSDAPTDSIQVTALIVANAQNPRQSSGFVVFPLT